MSTTFARENWFRNLEGEPFCRTKKCFALPWQRRINYFKYACNIVARKQGVVIETLSRTNIEKT